MFASLGLVRVSDCARDSIFQRSRCGSRDIDVVKGELEVVAAWQVDQSTACYVEGFSQEGKGPFAAGCFKMNSRREEVVERS